MTLRHKLLFAQLPAAATLLLLALAFLVAGQRLGDQSQGILKDNFRSVVAMDRIADAVDDLDKIFEEQGHLNEVATTVEFGERALQTQEQNLTEPGEGRATTQLRAAWDRFVILTNIAATAPGAHQPTGELRRAAYSVNASLRVVRELNLDAMVRKHQEVGLTVRRYQVVLWILALGACLLGAGLVTYLTARLLRPLRVLAQAARRVSSGDLKVRLRPTGSDELFLLAHEFNAMLDRLQSMRESSLGELLEVQAASQAAIDGLPDPVLVWNLRSELLAHNSAAESLLGVTLEASSPLAALDPGTRTVVETARSQVIGGRGAVIPSGFDAAFRTFTRQGEKWFLLRVTPLRIDEAGLDGAVMVFQDVTRVRVFDELKNDLVATAAHEFRTPLTSLRMALHLCLEELVGPLTRKQAELLQGAREDCERLQRMVDDMLSMARLRSGTATLQLQPLAAGELLSEALDTHRRDAQERGVTLSAEPAPYGLSLEGDPDRLRIVFDNLVRNALQVTPSGGQVTLRCDRVEEGRFVRFEVEDTGPGVSVEHQALVFDRFYQVPGRLGGKAGLGLSIVRDVIEAHNGRVGVEDGKKGGARFWFSLPLRGAGANLKP